MSTMAATVSWLGPFGPGLAGVFVEKSKRYFRLVSARCRFIECRRRKDDRGTNQPARADEHCTQASDDAIKDAEIRGSLPRPGFTWYDDPVPTKNPVTAAAVDVAVWPTYDRE
jgi:hypothetical protein